MKRLHAPAAVLLLAASLVPGRAATEPASRRGLAKAAAADAGLRGAALKPDRTVFVVVDAERNVFVNKKKVGTTEDTGLLKKRVRQAIKRNRRSAKGAEDIRQSGTVFVCASESTKYGDIVKVLDAVKQAGGDPVGLQTEPGGCDPPK